MGLIDWLMLAALALVMIGVEWELKCSRDFSERLDDYAENPR